MNYSNKVIDIYGTCICRDLFGLVPYNTYKVRHFLQASSQIVNFIYNSKPQKMMEENDFKNVKDINAFKRKCIINDYNKTVLDNYDDRADYYILDLVNIANTDLIKQTYDNNEVHYFTRSKWFTVAFEGGLKDSFFYNSKLETINRLKLLEEIGINDIIEKYVKWLIYEKEYTPEQIILIENKRAERYTAGKYIYNFETGTRVQVNDLLDEVYLLFEQKCRGCNVIKMPENTYADVQHKWGLTDLHFCYEYYEYLYKCIDLIIQKKECQNDIEQLYEAYSKLFEENVLRFEENSNDNIEGQQFLKGEFISNRYEHYITNVGQDIYGVDKKIISRTEQFLEIGRFNMPFAQIINTNYFVYCDSIIRGVSGNDKLIGEYWKTVNSSTCIIVKDYSLIIRHNGSNSRAQMNIIQTIDNICMFYGKSIKLSVWTKCHQISDDNERGGTIGIINAIDYNKGIFYAKKEFKNKDWKKIELITKLPDKKEFKGLTICMRANAGKNGVNSIVEYAYPKLEIWN